MKINKEVYLDKLHACWLGKNIGGTLGGPFEGRREFLDVKGFTTKPGKPLPNDDLDLQLVWLLALEREGAKKLSTNVLAEYWLQIISPHWNEYGIAKTNLSLGLLPPMSGEVDNDKWKTSNGAWIRSEIWAALTPCVPDLAIKYAVMDAIVDHGFNEGTYAEMFTAALESLAYCYSDLRMIIDRALSYIPENSIVARTVKYVIECYDNGIEYREAREKIIDFTKELGWFQAPRNLGFVTIGLIYGEGDFKKSILYAVNCGDDTDCTAGTVGAILGILGGTKSIPEDYKQFVGDDIISVSINGSYAFLLPRTCSELTERIYNLVPEVMKWNYMDFEFTDEDIPMEEGRDPYSSSTACEMVATRSKYSYEIDSYNQYIFVVEMDKHPRVKVGDERKVRITFQSRIRTLTTRKLKLRLILPETWAVGDYEKSVLTEYPASYNDISGISSTEFTITAGEKIDTTNTIYLELTSDTVPSSMLIPIVLLG